MDDIGIFASKSAVSIDGAFLQIADYRIFICDVDFQWDAYNIDCMLQVEETKKLGIEGKVNPRIVKLD